MQIYDIVVLVLLVIATAWGARRGFAKQLATLASLIVGYIVAVNFRTPVSQMIEAPEPWNLFAAMLMLFMGTSLLIWIAFQFVNRTIEKTGLEAFDAQMGGLFGLAKGFLISMAITMFAVVMLGDAPRMAVLNSFSGYNMCRLMRKSSAIVPTEWQQVIEPYLQTIEEHQQLVEQPEGFLPEDFTGVQSPSDSNLDHARYEDPAFGMATPSVPQADPVFQVNRSGSPYDSAQPRQTDSRSTYQAPLDSRR